MKYYTICLFGHRKIDDLNIIEKKLRFIINEILKRNDFVEIMIGRNGEFDEFAASIIKRLQKEGYDSRLAITLVLPYSCSNMDCLEKYYDGIIIPELASKWHPKGAIKKRNQYMVNCSDLVVVYVNKKGGAFDAFQFAKKSLKKSINLVEDCCFDI